MGYQLIVWEGKRPADDEDGRRACDEVTGRFLDGEQVDPTPAIREFVAALTKEWPDDPKDPEWELSPWTFPTLLDDASGPVLFLNLTMDVALLASTVVAALAEERGLVTYDPQVAMLRPVSEQVVAEYSRRWASALN